ncbi:MAG TPA: hypothetical protein VKY39_10400 [Aggregatilineales bacterium]|jgi:succinate dehydrogenase / fumarate reductase membrane anchor subunit|nr:hypothetical protein [Aggregatilineales bacterium]
MTVPKTTAHDFTRRTTAARATNRSATFWWRFMRWSGVLLIPLAFIHLAIVHLITSVAEINYQWVIETRWSLLGWRLYDAFLLWFAGLHGYRGALYVVNDYVHNPRLNRALTIILAVLLIAILALGSIALIGAPFELPG